MTGWCSLLLGVLLGVLRFTNPAPLLMGEQYVRQPFTWRSNGNAPDIGAYEYLSPYVPWRLGEVCFDGLVDYLDVRWCAFCFKGPGADLPRTIGVKATGDRVPVNCWLCDLDGDHDVDLRDYAAHKRLIPD